MSQNPSTSSSSSKFQLIINDALKVYNKRTKNDLLLHPLATELQNCESPSDIRSVLQQQVQVIDQSRSGEDRWTTWLDPTINVLLTFSQTAGTVGLAFSPATVVFAGIGVLLSAAKDARASHETLLDIFGRIEMFFRRLEIYTEVSLTTEMMDVIIEIMAEVLSVLGIATKEIKQGRTKKYIKKLIGSTDMEDALRKLDKLTQEEARMAVAENLRATHAVDERVRGVASTVLDIDKSVALVDGRVAGVDDQVARVDNMVAIVNDNVAGVSDRVASVDDTVKDIDTRVATVDDRLKRIDDKVAEVIFGGEETNMAMQQATHDLDQIKQNGLRRSIHKWLSPPDPSTNHNIACDTGHKKTAAWFFQSRNYQEWKSKGSLLWIHGKPGSGKSVLCSTVIQDIKAMCNAGNASMAYFYFDFRDAKKQGLQDLVRSLLTQLSARLASRCDILSKLYLDHDEGKTQPSNRDLIECLKEIFILPDQRPTYLIMDALDECPNAPGIPSPRQKVLQFVKELIDLCLPNLRICVTSRPEIDIRNVLEPLTSRRVSLHDQTGQKEDIADYVRSVVYSDSEQIMRWRTEDKEHVIKTLSERADGMFRWVFCQLEILRDCLPPSVRRILNELPESLDETYDRVLKEIKKPNRDHARRLLSCLVVAVRPLRVDELAEVLAVDYDDEEGIPRLNPNWRWKDQEQALLTSCSSLIAIVQSGDSRFVQFSHFSVKEYLTSTRLATSNQDVSRYHIVLEPAHTVLAQVCVSILLRIDNPVENGSTEKFFPLSGYAAEHWVRHAQFGGVVSRIKGVEYLFDPDKPYFAAWRELHDIDTVPNFGSTFFQFSSLSKSTSDDNPLYYAALCGFQDIAEHLILKYPHLVNTSSGNYLTPLVAALAGEHFQTAKSLRDNGLHPNIRGVGSRTPLHSAAQRGHLQMVQTLLEYKADPNARDFYGETPLYFLLNTFSPFSPGGLYSDTDPSLLHNVSRILLEHGADVNARADNLSTPLHLAAKYGRIEVVRVLLEYGADLNARTDDLSTPLHLAAKYGGMEAVRVLLEHGADVDAEDEGGRTPFQEASNSDVIKLLSEQRA